MKIMLKKRKKQISEKFEELLSYNSCLIKNNLSIILPGRLKKISFFNPDFIIRDNEIEFSFSYNTNKYNINFLKKLKKQKLFYNIIIFFRNDKIIFKNFNYNENTYKEIIYNKLKLKNIFVHEVSSNNIKVNVILNYKNKYENNNEINILLKKMKYNSLTQIEKYNKDTKFFEKDEE